MAWKGRGSTKKLVRVLLCVGGLLLLAVGTSVWANDAIAALRTVPGAVALPALGMMTLLLLRCDRKMRGAVRGRERYELLSRFNNEYLFEYDMVHDVLMLPQASAEFFGLSRVNAGFLARSNPAQQTPDNPLHAALCGLVGAPAEGVRELHCQLPDGRRRWLRMSVKVICERETPAWLVGKVLDIQRERETQERLLDKAQRDSLTNLYNAAISRQLVTAILQGAAEGPSGALMMLDVDRFKEVNDRWGHPAGDRLLIEVAQTLRAAFRSDDVIGRMGGDEFLVFMRDVQVRSTVEEKCNMLRERLAALRVGDGEESISLSIGVAMVGEDTDGDELYRRADQALYAVKNRGRNGFEIT